MSHKVRPTLALLALAVALGASGCGLFKTQTPESPTGGGGGLPPNLSIPESTLATMQRSIGSRNTTNFIQCLADTLLDFREFHATFDPSDLVEFSQSGRTPPADWVTKNEQTFLPQFFAYDTNTFYTLYFTVDNERGGITDLGGATQKKVYNLHYRVWAGANPVAIGSAGLTFERIGANSDYKVTFWEDRRDTTTGRTWGKARLNGQ
jgi:hypothetical protein